MSTLEVNTITPQSGTTLTLGGSGDTISLAGGATASGFGGIFESQLLHVRDEKSSGTGGGNSSASTDNERDLNTVVTNEITGASLSSNEITLPTGTYYISARIPAYRTGVFRGHLYNTADSSIEILGTSEKNGIFDDDSTAGFITGRFTISAQKTFKIRHYTNDSTTAGTAFGQPVNDGRAEVYTDVQIWKVA
jgi:hypothetical protein